MVGIAHARGSSGAADGGPEAAAADERSDDDRTRDRARTAWAVLLRPHVWHQPRHNRVPNEAKRVADEVDHRQIDCAVLVA